MVQRGNIQKITSRLYSQNSKKLHVGYIHKIPKNDKQVIYPKLQRGYIYSLVRGYIK
jgi:hypothetical protein